MRRSSDSSLLIVPRAVSLVDPPALFADDRLLGSSVDVAGEALAPYLGQETSVEERPVTGDNYGGEWPVAEFKKHSVAYALSEKHRSQLYLELIPAHLARAVFQAGT